MQYFQTQYKKLSFSHSKEYKVLMRIFITLFSVLLVSNSYAGCVEEALQQSNINPLTVTVSSTPGAPDEQGNVQMSIEVRGETFGGMVIKCDANNKLVEIVTPYSEIGLN